MKKKPVEGIERGPTEEGEIVQETMAASMAGLGGDEFDSRALGKEGRNGRPREVTRVLAQLLGVRLRLGKAGNGCNTASSERVAMAAGREHGGRKG